MGKMAWAFGGLAIYFIVVILIDVYGEGRDFSEQDHMHSEVEDYLHKDLSEVRTEEIEDSQPSVSQSKHLSGEALSEKTAPKSNEVVNEPTGGGTVEGTTNWYLPMDGTVHITSDYGVRAYFHSGVDLAIGGNPDNVKLKVVAPGVVTKVASMFLSGGSGPTGYGHHVEIEHDVKGEKHYSLYAHMKAPSKLVVGQKVNEGDLVGIMGNTGCGSCGRHLHLEIGYKDDANKSKFKSRNESQHVKKAPVAWWWKNNKNWVRSNPNNYFVELKGKKAGATVMRKEMQGPPPPPPTDTGGNNNLQGPKPISTNDIREFKSDSKTNPSKLTALVNKYNSLPESYTPANMRAITGVPVRHSSIKMTSTSAKALESLINGAKKDGIELAAFSGYRSYADQESAFNKHGKDETISAKPGHSEHQTGLVMDVSRAQDKDKDSSQALTSKMGEWSEGKWLADSSHKYGFIIRYPKGKEDITGYSYEPWHLRYVGVEVATQMKIKKYTLEEAYYHKLIK